MIKKARCLQQKFQFLKSIFCITGKILQPFQLLRYKSANPKLGYKNEKWDVSCHCPKCSTLKFCFCWESG